MLTKDRKLELENVILKHKEDIIYVDFVLLSMIKSGRKNRRCWQEIRNRAFLAGLSIGSIWVKREPEVNS